MVKTFWVFFIFFILECENFLFAWDWMKSCGEDKLPNIIALLKLKVFKALRGIIADESSDG